MKSIKDFFRKNRKTPNLNFRIDDIDLFDEFNYIKPLSQEDQDNLNALFDTVLFDPNFRYPRLPVFVKILDLIKSKRIDLNKMDLENEQVKLQVLNDLYNEIVNSESYTIDSLLMLWEIVNSLEYLYFITEADTDIIQLYSRMLEINYHLFEKDPNALTLKCLDRNILKLSELYANRGQFKKLIELYNQFLNRLESNELYNADYASTYLSAIEALIFNLKKNKLYEDIDPYLTRFINYINKLDILDEDIIFIIDSVTNTLCTSLFNIDLNLNKKDFINDLIDINKSLLTKNISSEDKGLVLITLSYLYFVLKDFNNVANFLRQEYKLNQKEKYDRNFLFTSAILGLINQISKETSKQKYSDLIKSVYNTDDQMEILQILTDYELDSDLIPAQSLMDLDIPQNLEEIKNSEAELENLLENNEDDFHLIQLASTRLALVYSDLSNGDIDSALDKLDSIQEISKKVKESGVYMDFESLDFLGNLLRDSIPLIENNNHDLNTFIYKIKKNMIAYHHRNKGNELNFNPVPFLIGLIDIFFKQNNKENTFKLIKETFNFIKLMFPYYQDSSDLDAFLMTLSQLRSRYRTDKILNLTEPLIDETFTMLSQLDISPEDYLNNNIYFAEAEQFEDLGLYKETIKLYKKALKPLFNYPDYKKIPVMNEFIGRIYFKIGLYQNHLREISSAIESLNNAITYLTRRSVSQENYLHLLDLLNSNLTLSEIYSNQNEIQKALDIVQRTHKIFKNTVKNITDDIIFGIYVDILSQEKFLLEILHRYQEGIQIFKETGELLSEKYVNFNSFGLILAVLDSFYIPPEGEKSFIKDYITLKDIENVYKKLSHLSLFKKAAEYDIYYKKSLLDLSLNYIEALIKNNRRIPDSVVKKAIPICEDLIIEVPEAASDLKEILSSLEFMLESQSYFRPNSPTKKKKVYNKKKTRSRNKRKRKKK